MAESNQDQTEDTSTSLPGPEVGLVRWALQEMCWNFDTSAASAAPREIT